MGNPKVLNNYGSFDVTFVKGKGATCFDVNGKKYIDFLAGIAVNVLGHNFKPLVKAVSKQAKKQIHVCNYFTSDAGIKFADKLLEATGFEGVYWGNSGAGARRRYYTITPAGKEACYRLLDEWKETKEIMDQLLITEE